MPAQVTPRASAHDLTNGPGAAALVAAGIGSFLLALFALIADKASAFKSLMIFWKPTGPLSGVTTSAVLAWLLIWFVLHRRWRSHTVNLGLAATVSLVLLAASLLLTFPPIVDLL
jgi:fluoride ion exporter CrcB/FEX